MRRLAILGAGGHGKVVADIAMLVGWPELVIFDDAWPTVKVNGRWPIVGDSAALKKSIADFDGLVIAIGHGATRLKRQSEFLDAGAKIVSLVHPRAFVSQFATVGIGALVCAGAVVNADAVLGEAVVVNSGATVDHDCLLSAGAHIAPGAHLSGNVQVGPCSWVGIGSCVKQGVRIGADVMIGAGAVVIADISDGVTVVGNPARALRDA